MICMTCHHYTDPDREMERAQQSEHCHCACHPWNRTLIVAADQDGRPRRILRDLPADLRREVKS